MKLLCTSEYIEFAKTHPEQEHIYHNIKSCNTLIEIPTGMILGLHFIKKELLLNRFCSSLSNGVRSIKILVVIATFENSQVWFIPTNNADYYYVINKFDARIL